MTVIYVDRVFLLNTALDYLLLLSAARLAGIPLRRVRLLLCAAAGGLYASAVFFPHCGWLAHPAARLLSGVLMAWAAFAGEPRRRKLILLFFLLAGALAGVVLALGLASGSPNVLFSRIYYADISWPVLLLSAVGFYLLLHLVFRQGARHGGGELMDVTVSIAGKQSSVRVLYDTGNTLRNPVNAQPVLVLERRVLQDFWTKDERRIMSDNVPAEEKMARLYRQGTQHHFSLLPFRSVGTAGGLLLAVRSALSDHAVSDGGGYQGLWGGEGREESSHVQAMVAEDQAVDHTA